MNKIQYDNWKLQTPEEDQSNYNEDSDEYGDKMDREYEKIKEEKA